MKDILIKLVFFSVFLSLAVTIMQEAIPGFDNPSFAGGLGDSNMYDAQTGINELGGDLSPEALVEDESDMLDRLLDSIGLGIFNKVLNFLDKWMFGFVNMLQGMFGGFFSETLNTLIFGGFKTMITLLYVITAIWFFTGKDIGEKY